MVPSKAAIINFCETLYYELLSEGVRSSLGFVATEATAQNDFEMPALISADEAAKEILNGIKGRSLIFISPSDSQDF